VICKMSTCVEAAIKAGLTEFSYIEIKLRIGGRVTYNVIVEQAALPGVASIVYPVKPGAGHLIQAELLAASQGKGKKYRSRLIGFARRQIPVLYKRVSARS